MIEAVEPATGFCTISIPEIAKRACCSTKTVKAARKALKEAALFAGPGGVYVPCSFGELNRNQRTDKTAQKQAAGTIEGPSLYRLVFSDSLSNPSLPSAFASKPFQPDMFGAPVVDLASYRRGQLPSDLAAAVRAEMRARGVTQDELAALLGISQP